MSNSFISPEAVLTHWQGHRRLTRRVIGAFPDDQLFSFAVGGMRPFGDMTMEILYMSVPMLRGLVTGNWDSPNDRSPRPRADLLHAWDNATREIDTLFRQISPDRFLETATAFGQYTAPIHELILYVVDNEIHHRGQGFVYLRALGIEPPKFFDRR